MAVTNYRVVQAISGDTLIALMTTAIADGWQPYGPMQVMQNTSGVFSHTLLQPCVKGGIIVTGDTGATGPTGPAGVLANGRATLVTGTKTITSSDVAADSVILATVAALGTVAAPKALKISNIVPGESFDVSSADATDTSVVSWAIVTPI